VQEGAAYHEPVRRFLAIILLIAGVAAIVAGLVYLTEPANLLPSFFPGYAAQVVSKDSNHGYEGIVLGAVFIIAAFVVAFTRPRRRPFS